jgi:tetratricopeptide (TPR) repeat protein
MCLLKNYFNKMQVSKTAFVLLLIFLCLYEVGKAQSVQKKILELADESFQKRDFPAATYYYRSYLDKDSLDPKIWFQYAQCCERIFLYKKAIYSYEKVQKLDLKKQYKELGYSLANCYKITGDYKKAIKLFDKTARSFKKKNPKLYEQCLKDKKICQDAIVELQGGELVKKLPAIINQEDAEYSPFYKDSTLYYIRKEEADNIIRHHLMSIKSGEKKQKKYLSFTHRVKRQIWLEGLVFIPPKMILSAPYAAKKKMKLYVVCMRQ